MDQKQEMLFCKRVWLPSSARSEKYAQIWAKVCCLDSLPSKSTCPSPFRSMSRRISSKSLCPTWKSQFKGCECTWHRFRQTELQRGACTCCPSSFFMASLSSAVLIWPSPLVSNWGRKWRHTNNHQLHNNGASSRSSLTCQFPHLLKCIPQLFHPNHVCRFSQKFGPHEFYKVLEVDVSSHCGVDGQDLTDCFICASAAVSVRVWQ